MSESEFLLSEKSSGEVHRTHFISQTVKNSELNILWKEYIFKSFMLIGYKKLFSLSD